MYTGHINVYIYIYRDVDVFETEQLNKETTMTKTVTFLACLYEFYDKQIN